MTFPSDPTVFRDRVAPTGALRKSLLEDFTAPSPPYVSEEDHKYFIETFQRGGFTGPTCWYKVMTNKMSAEDDKRATLNLMLVCDESDPPYPYAEIPPERMYPPVSAPIFFGVGQLDYVCTPALGNAQFGKPEFKQHKVTTKEYDADHWFILSKPEQLSRDLVAWIEGFTS
jgi:soluble epoxide hydrolase / lipid-phosphate phosphatase